MGQTTAISTPAPGQIARIRQRTYLIEEIVEPRRVKDSTLVRLSCVDDDNQGAPLEVLWEKELDPQILSGEAWESIASQGFDDSKLFAAYLNTLKWNCVTSTDPKLFQSPFRAGIRLDAYQLEPLRKALRLPRVNLFIADDVGLGKTIEAGLIARELLLRKKVKDIIVSCPPSMLLQWKEELESRFGLTFEILDKDYMKRVRRERGFSINPWSTHSRFLVSHRLLIDETYAGPLRDHLGTFRSGSLLILDEAHHAAPSSGQKYAIDSQITRAVRDLAPRFEHRLFLSATPHNGHSNSFSALLEILDPQRFCRGVPVADRMRVNESLNVKFFFDIQRRDHDTTESSILVWRFMQRLRNEQWPEGCRLPDVYYDPRSSEREKRSSLHAKCIVVDKKIAFVSSANFTNAGQERNIEVGVLLRTPMIAQQLANHFEKLIDCRSLLKAEPARS